MVYLVRDGQVDARIRCEDSDGVEIVFENSDVQRRVAFLRRQQQITRVKLCR